MKYPYGKDNIVKAKNKRNTFNNSDEKVKSKIIISIGVVAIGSIMLVIELP